MRLLQRQLQELSPAWQAQVEALSLSELTDLGEASLDFSDRADLLRWLDELQAAKGSAPELNM